MAQIRVPAMVEAFQTRARVKSVRHPARAEFVGTVIDPFRTVGPSPYEAGSTKPRVVRWNPTSSGPNALLAGSLDLIRRRSRERIRNDGSADIILDTLVTNLVGIGIKPMFQTPDKDFNKFLAQLWLRWTDEADADGALDFYGLQALAVREALEAGECFIRKRFRRPEDGLSVPIQLQLLEAEHCPIERNTNFDNSRARTIQGVSINGFGLRVGYWLYRDHPGDNIGRQILGSFANQSFVNADEIMHLRVMRRAGTVRGEPWLTRALIKLDQVDKYDDAQLARQQVAQMFAGMVETDPLFAAEFFAGQQVDPSQPGQYFDVAPLSPAQIQFLNPGQHMNWNNPPGPGSDYEGFMRTQGRRLAMAGRILYEQATGDYSQVNDRTWRAAMLDFRRRVQMMQEHMLIFQMCSPTLNGWVDMGILSGAIKLPAQVTADDIKAAMWITDRWDYINPVQDIAAEVAEVLAGFVSRKAKVSERGDDIERLDEEIASDQAREADMDLMFSSNGQHAHPAPAAAPTEPDQPPPGKKPRPGQ